MHRPMSICYVRIRARRALESSRLQRQKCAKIAALTYPSHSQLSENGHNMTGLHSHSFSCLTRSTPHSTSLQPCFRNRHGSTSVATCTMHWINTCMPYTYRIRIRIKCIRQPVYTQYKWRTFTMFSRTRFLILPMGMRHVGHGVAPSVIPSFSDHFALHPLHIMCPSWHWKIGGIICWWQLGHSKHLDGNHSSKLWGNRIRWRQIYLTNFLVLMSTCMCGAFRIQPRDSTNTKSARLNTV